MLFESRLNDSRVKKRKKKEKKTALRRDLREIFAIVIVTLLRDVGAG